MEFEWKGVMPAITTCFNHELEIDHEFTKKHVEWLVSHGSTGIIANGSLGEGATLTLDEKFALWHSCVEGVGGKVPVIASIASLSTRDGIALARAAKDAGCSGLMVLPPYVHKGDQREYLNHVSAIINNTELPCMLYNNPIAYGVDFTPEDIERLFRKHENLQAVKESGGDVRRITAVKALLGDEIDVFVGLDDYAVEGAHAGATGWVAGLVNALPAESVKLFQMALDSEDCTALYNWFLPLLRLDVVPKFVQLIKLVQQEVEMGNERVRPPRLELIGEERIDALHLIRDCLEARPMA